MRGTRLTAHVMLAARLLRRSMRRAQLKWRYRGQELDRTPVLFANSFPKSGTHLLTQVLAGFTQLGPACDSGLPAVVTFEGDSGRARPEAEIVADLRRFLPGDIGYGHVHALPGARDVLCQKNFASYFMLRDPRDVVVSHVHYVTDMETKHIHHGYYTQVLQTFDQRLSASIAGFVEADGAEVGLPDVRQRFAPFLGWMDCPQVLPLRYEAFLEARQKTLEEVLEHALRQGFPLMVQRSEALERLSASINPSRSPTFRSGKAGGWRGRFTQEHKALFKQVTGDLLLRLGYEQDQDW